MTLASTATYAAVLVTANFNKSTRVSARVLFCLEKGYIMLNFEEEKNLNFKNFLKINDTLCPKLFDAQENMRPEVRQKLLDIAAFMDNYTNNIFVNLTTTDIVLSGSMGGYTYSDDSDIDLMILLQTDEKIISAEEFEQQFIFLNSGLVGRGYKFDIRGHNVDYKWHTDTPPSSGIYSVKNNIWLSRPMKRQYAFTPEEFTAKMSAYVQKVDEFMNNLPKNERNFLTLESCEKAEEFYKALRKENDRVLTTSPDKEFDIDYAVYRCFRRYGKHGKIMEAVTRSYADNLSS